MEGEGEDESEDVGDVGVDDTGGTLCTWQQQSKLDVGVTMDEDVVVD